MPQLHQPYETRRDRTDFDTEPAPLDFITAMDRAYDAKHNCWKDWVGKNAAGAAMLKFGGKMPDCGPQGGGSSGASGPAVGVDRLVHTLGEAQMRDLLGKPPQRWI